MHFYTPPLNLVEELFGLLQQLFVTPLEPLDEDRGVNDDLCAHSGYRDSNG